MSMRNPTHPGAGIRDDLSELGWTMTEAARRMGVRRENLSLLIHGQIGISPKMALALERVGISNAEFGCGGKLDTIWPGSGYGRNTSSR